MPPGRGGYKGYFAILGTSALGGGREKAGKAPAAGRRDVKLVAASMAMAMRAPRCCGDLVVLLGGGWHGFVGVV